MSKVSEVINACKHEWIYTARGWVRMCEKCRKQQIRNELREWKWPTTRMGVRG